MDNGIHNITDEEYFAAEGLSNSYLWTLGNKTPAHAQVPFPATDAMDLGSAVHIAVLQPELAATMIVQGPKDRRGKKWTEAKEEAEAKGQVLLVEKDYATAMTMRDKVWQNPVFAELLTGADVKYEHAAFWQHQGIKCKCKIDCAKPDVLIDLKTSADASPRGFANSVLSYGYHQQAASYKHGWNKAAGSNAHTFLFLVIEKSPPFAPAIYELDAPTLAEGWASYLAAIELNQECLAAETFPGYAPEKVLLQIPPYGFRHTNPRGIDLKGTN